MGALQIETIPAMKVRCGQWSGAQCKATTKLTACVLTVQQGKLLKGPEKVVVHLCGKHFQLLIPRTEKRATQIVGTRKTHRRRGTVEMKNVFKNLNSVRKGGRGDL